MRDLMERGTRDQENSWLWLVEAVGDLHEFLVADDSHPESEEIERRGLCGKHKGCAA